MKKHTVFLLMALAILSASLRAEAFPPRLDGTMMPYDFAAADSLPPWGAEYKPVFISYVARHGARFLSSEKKVDGLEKVLEKTAADGTITPKGREFLALLKKVREKTDGNWGALNHVGKTEERRLGREMAATCPELLKEGRIEAGATYVPRVVMTMYELCHELAVTSSGLEISTSEGRQFNPLLRYFKTDSSYVEFLDNGPWLPAYGNFFRGTVPVGPAASMFKEVMDSHRLQKLTMDAYGVLQSLRAAEIEADPSKWFSESEYRDCWEVANLRHYYQRSVSSFSDLPARCALPLLDAIVGTVDSIFEARKDLRLRETLGIPGSEAHDLKGRFYFGHAETVIPLFALMKLPGCYAPLLGPAEVAAKWKDWEVAPLGANLMLVCLEDGEGRPYVALRLNGRWIGIEGEKVMKWSKLRHYWRG